MFGVQIFKIRTKRNANYTHGRQDYDGDYGPVLTSDFQRFHKRGESDGNMPGAASSTSENTEKYTIDSTTR